MSHQSYFSVPAVTLGLLSCGVVNLVIPSFPGITTHLVGVAELSLLIDVKAERSGGLLAATNSPCPHSPSFSHQRSFFPVL